MERFSHSVLRHRKLLIIFFLIAVVLSALLAPKTKINYDLSAYIPEQADSTRGMNLAKEEFKEAIPNVEVMVPDISVSRALEIKAAFAKLNFVKQLLWLDDQVDLTQPLDMLDKELVDGFYQNGAALFRLTIETKKYAPALQELRAIAGENAALRGQIVDLARANSSVADEMIKIVLFAVPAAMIILLISTTSWFEPVLFLLAILVGVVLNMGTNVLLGEISFITQSVGAVLQLAVSMDYAIFMLRRFSQYREEGHEPVDAMAKAMAKAFSSITASAMTTLFGFLSLVFMRFKLGPDMGIVLAKGIVFSMISCIFLLPCLILLTYKIVDKSSHRPLLPSFDKLGGFIVKAGIPILIIVLIVAGPVFLAQRQNHFLYGMGSYPSDSREEKDRLAIVDRFGRNMQMVVLVPKGDLGKEALLAKDLQALPEVKTVIGYANAVGNSIPSAFVPEDQLKRLQSSQYSRYIVIADVPPEGESTFALAEKIRSLARNLYGAKASMAGENFTLVDMRDTIKADDAIVNGLAILAVALVLLLTFQSLSLPLILVFTIEFSIWINLSLPYFTGNSLNYIGYLVISTIQLGATVDYAILLTQHYLDNRRLMPKKIALRQSIAEAAPAIIPPALILTLVGFVLAAISSIPVVSQLGLVLGRGAALSLMNVLFVLPNLLIVLDPLVRVSTRKANFWAKTKNEGGINHEEAS